MYVSIRFHQAKIIHKIGLFCNQTPKKLSNFLVYISFNLFIKAA